MSFPILSDELSKVKTFHCPHNPMITDDKTGIIKQVGCGLANGKLALEYFAYTAPSLDIPILTSPIIVTIIILGACILMSLLIFWSCRQSQGKKREMKSIS